MRAWGNKHLRALLAACVIGLVLGVPVAIARLSRVSLRAFSVRHSTIGTWTQPALWNIVRGVNGTVWFSATGASDSTPYSAIGSVSATGRVREFVLPGHASVASLGRGQDGKIWFTAVNADQLTSEVGRITTSGRLIVVATGLSPLVNGIAAGPGGDMWVGDQSNVYRVTPRGAVTTFALPTPYTAFNLVQGPDGNMWFTSVLTLDGPHPDAIGRITPGGKMRFFTIPSNDSAPDGIAVGPDRNLWFGEGAGRIGRITTSGQVTEFATGYRVSKISAVVAGPGRRMWFMDRGRRAVGEITMSGRVREFRVPAPADRFELFSLTRGAGSSLWFTVTSALKIDRLIVN